MKVKGLTDVFNSSLLDISSSELDSLPDDSEPESSESSSENYYTTIITNQKQIIDNQNTTISYLGTICFLITISIGIYLAILFGKWIYNLIN